MNKLNWLLTLSSINVILVTLERFSFTTKILLSPDSFLRLHEVFQIATLILFTVLLPTYYLKELTDNFNLLKVQKGFLLLLVFVTGIYFYSTGNGIHELASFQFNHFCDTKNFTDTLCKGMFFNDYYFGNGVYFLGAMLMVVPLLVFETMKPLKEFVKKEKVILIANALFYSLAIFAYAAFDRVLVGLVFTLLMMIISWVYFFKHPKKRWQYPFTIYTFLAYTVGGVASLLVRLFHT